MLKYKLAEKKSFKMVLRHLLSAPIIYGMVVPIFIFDVTLEIYHRICFKLYKIKYVRRSHYIKIDRHKLEYLSLLEKFNCMYCGYANGLMSYASVIIGLTESYWCGIMHQKSDGFYPPAHHQDFLPYGDEEAFERFLKN